MNKLQMESVDMTKLNIDKIGAIFPNCITESIDENGNLKKAINFDILKQMLSSEAIDGDEAYEFTWVGKKASIVEANKPIRKTLRPFPEESVDWGNTENLYIEGDNLEVLKLLQESYLKQIKMIYIDPPYNTGNDFIFNDNFKKTEVEYIEEIGKFDNDGNRLFKNTDSNGRFHSDWCSMIYSRLMLARNLLTDDGVIFISIDDAEIKNMKNICDEIFGTSNFISQLIWQKKQGGGNDSKFIAVEHEYILVYAFNKYLLGEFYEKYSDDYIKRYKEKDEKGRFFWDTFKRKSGKQYYPITCPDGTILQYDEDGNEISWLRSKKRFETDLKEGEVRIIKNGEKWSVQFKQRMPLGKTPRSIFTTESVICDKGTTKTGANDIYDYFKKDVFSNPKPIDLINFLLGFTVGKDDIVLDFFSGSGTTAEAIMKYNISGNNVKFILVQLQENIDLMLKSTSANAKRIAENAVTVLNEMNKPHYITELAKERIRRAGSKIKKENPLIAQNLDTGFRVLKLDDSNMNDVYYSPEEYSQDLLSILESNVKSDRTDLDLLFGCLLEWGLPLSLPYSSEQIDGCTVHNYNDGDLIACFDENVPDSVIKSIAKKQPLRAVFRDSSFADSPSKINVEEIFKLMSPDTRIKVI
ncbi:site-specific DNA-methyltransferase [Coprobacillus sp. AM26-5AC]|jgi:adenine-specific DNA-methyltransferase|uniref:site-specific DNA-methyltransferase n=1 Tax=Faecalibacillus intestinalis TaxID=1982626 RepID=UPI000E4E3B87|nr:site-specific DNA-methyltransferase [Faecalibacillus intestinalis]RGI01768.1 site-specific DNA-methyltransferase [Coprobacillus sp. AM26-5AC]